MAYSAPNLTKREALIEELARDVQNAPERYPVAPSNAGLAKLKALGTQTWLDTGNLEEAAKLWKSEMSALTTNNTLANQVVQTGIMDDVIHNAARRIKDVEPGVSAADLVLDIAFVVNCHIALRLVRAFDVLVSVELHPAIGNDIETTFRYAQRYFAVNPDRFIVKIPMTPEGFCSVARSRAEGIPINYTLGFSARQNYLAAAFAHPTYVNVFLGRLNAVVADNKLGDGKNVGEKVTLASQQGLIELRTADPARPTYQIAASMRSGEQMVSLAGLDVYTAPPKAVGEFFASAYDPATITNRISENYSVTLNEDVDASSVEVLWEINENFKKFAKQLASGNCLTMTGDDLRAADKDFGTKLFSNFTQEEAEAIRTHGKIPNTSKWAGRASLDDLMTESALQSFIVDQGALDARILKIVSQA